MGRAGLQFIRTRCGSRPILTLLLAVVLVATTAIPAVAQTSLEVENEAESDDASITYGVDNEGDYAMQCTPAQQFGNTGNLNNSPAVVQYGSRADDIEPGGIEFTIEPTVDAECDQSVQQSSAASSDDGCWWWWDGAYWWCWDDTYWWLWDGAYWWLWDGAYWWWWDGVSWGTVSNVATGAFHAARGPLPLIILGALALIGIGGIGFRRNRRRD